MYTRLLSLQDKSFFLFGPRGVGKSTSLRQLLPKAEWINLLTSDDFLPLLRNPADLSKRVLALKAGSWVVIDEIQKLPQLLDEVHSLMQMHLDKKNKFALTGSSARKLKRAEANMLAGRAISKKMFPLTQAEIHPEEISIQEILSFGMLPGIVTEKDKTLKIKSLESYVTTYLREEIQQEALVKNLDSFFRFLQVAAIANAQKTNVSQIASDAGVARPTVHGYFDILTDTLIGYFLPAWRRRLKVKEKLHPKFYLFDPGVVRALSGNLREPLDSVERGHLFETYILHELRSYIEYSDIGGELFYWGTSNDREMDFIWQRGKRAVGIEVKSSNKWRNKFSEVGNELVEDGTLQAVYGVYLGDIKLKDHHITILPVKEFLASLQNGKIL